MPPSNPSPIPSIPPPHPLAPPPSFSDPHRTQPRIARERRQRSTPLPPLDPHLHLATPPFLERPRALPCPSRPRALPCPAAAASPPSNRVAPSSASPPAAVDRADPPRSAAASSPHRHGHVASRLRLRLRISASSPGARPRARPTPAAQEPAPSCRQARVAIQDPEPLLSSPGEEPLVQIRMDSAALAVLHRRRTGGILCFLYGDQEPPRPCVSSTISLQRPSGAELLPVPMVLRPHHYSCWPSPSYPRTHGVMHRKT